METIRADPDADRDRELAFLRATVEQQESQLLALRQVVGGHEHCHHDEHMDCAVAGFHGCGMDGGELVRRGSVIPAALTLPTFTSSRQSKAQRRKHTMPTSNLEPEALTERRHESVANIGGIDVKRVSGRDGGGGGSDSPSAFSQEDVIRSSSVEVTSSKKFNFWQRPRLFKSWDEVETLQRKVAWPELFYDLIVVAAIIQLGDLLKHHNGAAGVATVAVLYYGIWSTWQQCAIYTTRFHTEDFAHSAYQLLLGLATLCMTVHVQDAFSVQSRIGFAIGIAFSRMVFIGIYGAVFKWEATGRAKTTAAFQIGSGAVSATSFLITTAFPDDTVAVMCCWIFGFIFEAGSSVYLGLVFRSKMPPIERQKFLLPIDVEHMAERNGLLVMIVLGESLIALTQEAAARDTEYYGLLTAGFVLVFCLQILYFETQPEHQHDHAFRRSRFTGIAFSYLHYILQLSLIWTGVGLKLALSHVHHTHVGIGDVWLLCCGCFTALTCFHIVRLLHKAQRATKQTSPQNFARARSVSAISKMEVGEQVRVIKKRFWVARVLLSLLMLFIPIIPSLQPAIPTTILASFGVVLVIIEGASHSDAVMLQAQTAARNSTSKSQVIRMYTAASAARHTSRLGGHHGQHHHHHHHHHHHAHDDSSHANESTSPVETSDSILAPISTVTTQADSVSVDVDGVGDAQSMASAATLSVLPSLPLPEPRTSSNDRTTATGTPTNVRV